MRKIFYIEKGKYSSWGGGGGGIAGKKRFMIKKCFAAARGLFSSYFRKLTLLNKRFRLCEDSSTFPPIFPDKIYAELRHFGHFREEQIEAKTSLG